ncbi:MAG: hypothetical protein OEZ34_03750, partial [Spirochaetia bacterium]|nr:hypothetical protein [Spirochaetia bacterium]
MTKEEYTRKIHDLRIKMLELQYNMRKSNIPVILILSGMTGAGKGHLSYRLNEWMDPRYIRTHAFWDETDDEKERPYLWRFFRHMPAAGEIGIFFHAWYRPILHGRILKRTNRKETAEKIQEILKLETMLAEDGCQVIKFWFYLSRNDQKKLLKAKRKSLKKLTKDEKQIIKKYNDFEKESSVILKASSTERSPWHNIDASDRKQAEIRLMETFIEVSEKCLSSLKKPENSGNISEGSSSGREKQIQEAHKIKNTSQVKSLTQNENNVTQLGQADLTLKLDPDVYKTELARLMKKIDERSFRSFHQ